MTGVPHITSVLIAHMRRYNLPVSTKSERRVHEVLKELHIPFKHRWKIEDIEVDFLIGNTVIEIDGHKQDPDRNHKLLRLGITPIHLTNEGTKDPNYLKDLILTL